MAHFQRKIGANVNFFLSLLIFIFLRGRFVLSRIIEIQLATDKSRINLFPTGIIVIEKKTQSIHP